MGRSATETRHQWLSAFASRGQPARVLIALGAALVWCALGKQLQAALPLVLGIAASALAETDDGWRGRLRMQLVALACFAIAVPTAALLSGRPLAFAAMLAAAAFVLTMLGAADARCKPVGRATLLLALSVLLAAGPSAAPDIERGRWLALVMAGAAGYGLLSVLWCAVLPVQPVQLRLIRLFVALGDCMHARASLLARPRRADFERDGLSLALGNAAVVEQLNAAKESILRRGGAPTERIARARRLYLVAQEVHERASAFDPEAGAPDEGSLDEALMARCRHVLMLQAEASGRLARSIARHESFAPEAAASRALVDLRAAIADAWRSAGALERTMQLPAIEAIARNLAQLDDRLAGAGRPDGRTVRTDLGSLDRTPRSWRETARRVRRQFTARSALLHHALRMSLALLAGGGVAWLLHPAQGGWILLAVFLVCSQTARENAPGISLRMAGALAGFAAGWLLLQLLPAALPHALLAAAAVLLFFSVPDDRPPWATGALALWTMLCAGPAGIAELPLGRGLAGTAAGCVIAALALLLLWPYWQPQRINELAAATLRSHAGYLRQAIEQYRAGPHDDLAYRLARRNAHNADAALSAAVADLLRDPRWMWPRAAAARRFLLRSHTLLGALSALGAQRAALPDPQGVARLREAADDAATALERLAARLDSGAIGTVQAGPGSPDLAGMDWEEGTQSDPAIRIARMELSRIWRQIEALRRHAREWLPSNGGGVPDEAGRDIGGTR